MFSIKKTIDELDRGEQRFQTALNCYLAAISGIHEHAVEVTPELTDDYGRSLRALHRDLCDSPSIEKLTLSRTTLTNALADYQDKATACLSKKEEDLRAMLTSLAEAAETLSGHNERRADWLKRFTQQLQIVARGGDLSQMRRDLARQLEELKQLQDEMSGDNSRLIADMHKQLTDFKERLESTEKRAATDALTGLLNRGEGEARLAAQLAAGQTVSVILVDLDNFKRINDRFGHGSGDQVLKTFGHILSNSIRPSDTVCRWGGDEFLVMMTGNERIDEQRAVQFRERLKTRCQLVMLGKLYDLNVNASAGFSQARAGDTVSDLLARADTDLYRHKRDRKAPNGLQSQARTSALEGVA